MPASTARILEIGGMHLIKTQYPDRTTALWTGWRPNKTEPRLTEDCTPGRLLRAMRDVRAGRYDLVVTYLPRRSHWHPRYWLRSLAHTPLKPYSSLSRVSGVAWLRYFRIPVPLVAIDLEDHFGIGRHNFFLLDKADAVFKRELPSDRWQLLTHSAHPSLPTRRIRASERWQRRLEKIRPLAIPVPEIDVSGLWEGEFPAKTVDVFFSGDVETNSWVRRAGISELRALAGQGIVVDIPTERLPLTEYYRRLARAWLAWAPSGFGWECNRTAEAAQCLCVPVVNHPPIERYQPLRDCEHLFQHDVEPGGLTRAIRAALVDKDRLKQMALAARRQAIAHHVGPRIVDHVIETGLSLRRPRA